MLYHLIKKPTIIIFLIGLFLFLFLLNISTLNSNASDVTISDTPVTRNVFLLIFNPIMDATTSQKLTALKNWNDPDTITNDVVSRLHAASNNYITYTLQERQEVDGYPTKVDGFQYTNSSYLTCVNNNSTCHIPDTMDYQLLFQTYNICAKNVDEVWIWGGPWFGLYEFNPVSYCGKTTFVMGFNYERTVGEAVHNFGHRMEYVANNRVNRGLPWQQDSATEWNKYSTIASHCGNVHYPPGTIIGQEEYIYNKTTPVTTDCNGYLNYPVGPFTFEDITCGAWGCSQEGYISWWLNHIPHNPGVTTDPATGFEIYNNWWKYYAFFDETYIPPVPGTFSNLSAVLGPTSAQYQFAYSGTSASYRVDMSTLADMSHDVYLNFGGGGTSPITIMNPQSKWDKYRCGATLYWKIYNSDLSVQSPIQSATVTCLTPTLTPPPPTMTPTPTTVPTPQISSILPTADTVVKARNPSTIYGTNTTLISDGNPVEISYMKFNLTALTGKTIVSAKLRLRITRSSKSTHTVKRVPDTTWTESATNYNNRPALSSAVTSFVSGSNGTWKEIDITQEVAPLAGQIFSVAVDTTGSDGMNFNSKEASTNKPALVVTYQ